MESPVPCASIRASIANTKYVESVIKLLQHVAGIFTITAVFREDSPLGRQNKTKPQIQKTSMKQSITEKFASDAIAAPAAVTGGGGKCGGGKSGGGKSKAKKSGGGKSGGGKSGGSGSGKSGSGRGGCPPPPKCW